MGVGGWVAEVVNLRMQIPESRICNPSIGEGNVDERVDSHKKATPL